MTEQEFQANMTAAKTFSELGDEQEFWAGYMRGLRRNYHGENFGTDEEHALWMAAANSTDKTRKMRGLGYQAGFEGQRIQQALKTLEVFYGKSCN